MTDPAEPAVAVPSRPTGIALFLKFPEPGTVKSRLHAALGPERAAQVYWECALLMMAKAQRLREADVFAFYTPAERGRDVAALVLERFGRFEGRFIAQRGRTLGERMHHALERLRIMGFERQIVLGTETPTLPQEYLQQAVAALAGHACVIGPTWNGGCYLVGVQRPDVRLFRDIAWGSGRELAQAWENLTALGWTARLLPRWHGVDAPDDLPFLQGQVRHADYRRLQSLLTPVGPAEPPAV